MTNDILLLQKNADDHWIARPLAAAAGKAIPPRAASGASATSNSKVLRMVLVSL